MSFSIFIHSEAEIDLKEAYDDYEKKVENLGLEFLGAFKELCTS